MSRIDTRHTVETPEGVSFHIYPAGPVPRIQAAAIDLVLRSLLMLGAVCVLQPLGNAGAGVALIAAFAINWGYSIYFEMYHRGMTPGKMVYGLQVRSDDGTPVSWRGSILRNLLRVADFLPFAYVGGICVMATTNRFRRLGDLAADTVVCYKRDESMPDSEALPDAAPRRAPRRLEVHEQRAIVEFALRSKQWSEERNRELARVLQPLTGVSDPEDAVEYLRGVANGILHGSS